MSAWRVDVGDCRELLAAMPDGSVQCCVTSPPYWVLRDYGTASWSGGDPACEHKPRVASISTRPLGLLHGGHATVDAGTVQRDCHCGAVRVDSQLGLERSPDEYVAAMVAVFEQVRRVLRSDGTLWLNLGDSYAAGGPAGGPGKQHTNVGSLAVPTRSAPQGLKPKDLVGIPWRVAFALQAAGWWLRSDIIWAKPNPMPESVTDRPTKSHEYLFLLTKSERYFYDAQAIAEPVTDSTIERVSQPTLDQQKGSPVPFKTNGNMHAVVKRSGNKERKCATERDCPAPGVAGSVPWEGTTRNKRTVWTVTTKPFSEAHFATFPPELIEPCIKAGTSERGHCPKCGERRRRIVERTSGDSDREPRGKALTSPRNDGSTWNENGGRGFMPVSSIDSGWTTCECGVEAVPDMVLDPFSGAGTTGLVCTRLDRSLVGLELNPVYADMARRRIMDDAPLLNGGAHL